MEYYINGDGLMSINFCQYLSKLTAFFLICFLTTTVYAQNKQSDVNSQEQIMLIKKHSEMNSKIKNIESENYALKKEIAELKNILSESQEDKASIKFAEWMSFLLAAVSAIVTVLGVGIAIFSFFGYKKIMSSAADIATSISTRVVAEVAAEQVPSSVQNELINLVEQGRFDTAIYDAVARVTFRGIDGTHDDDFSE